MSRRKFSREAIIGLYRDIQYRVVQKESDIWDWQFNLGGMVKTGRTETRLALMAVRRVKRRIDAELRKNR